MRKSVLFPFIILTTFVCLLILLDGEPFNPWFFVMALGICCLLAIIVWAALSIPRHYDRELDYQLRHSKTQAKLSQTTGIPSKLNDVNEKQPVSDDFRVVHADRLTSHYINNVMSKYN